MARPAAVMLGRFLTANMNTTADQAITLSSARCIVTEILVDNASISLTLAAGGLYTAVSKGGNAVVAATQLYSALTATTKLVRLTVAAIGLTDVVVSGTLYLSLTTAQGSAATADVRVYGYPLD